MESPQLPEKRNNEKIYLGIIALLAVVCAVLTWQLIEQRANYQTVAMERSNIESERNELKEELNSMLNQYDKLKTNNQKLSTEMKAQEAKIKELLGEIDKNKGNVTLIAKYKREVVTLRTIMKSYVVTIDSLNTVNQQLTTENTQVKTELGDVKSQASQLRGQNDEMTGIIAKASLLKTYEVAVDGVRVRSNGKQQETDRAKTTEIIRVCFKVGENNTTRAGAKSIYIRVIKPDGSTLVGSGAPEAVTIDGKQTSMSGRREIVYKNEEQDMCIYANADGSMNPGNYTIQIFESGSKIGSASLNLK